MKKIDLLVKILTLFSKSPITVQVYIIKWSELAHKEPSHVLMDPLMEPSFLTQVVHYPRDRKILILANLALALVQEAAEFVKILINCMI